MFLLKGWLITTVIGTTRQYWSQAWKKKQLSLWGLSLMEFCRKSTIKKSAVASSSLPQLPADRHSFWQQTHMHSSTNGNSHYFLSLKLYLGTIIYKFHVNMIGSYLWKFFLTIIANMIVSMCRIYLIRVGEFKFNWELYPEWLRCLPWCYSGCDINLVTSQVWNFTRSLIIY